MFPNSEILERFIVIEGIDGAGTSTQRSLLCRAMKQHGLSTHETWEPTEGPVGRLIRQVLRKEIQVSAATLCRLFAADRAEHCHATGGIVDLCRQGTYVVSDRYSFSSYAYQGLHQEIDWIANLNAGFPMPEYLFFVDVDTTTSRQRREARGEEAELFDEDPVQAAVRSNYQRIMQAVGQEFPQMHILFLDGAQSIAEIHRQISNFLSIPPIQ